MCLLGDIDGEILWWWCNLPTKIYSAKASEFLTWVRYEDRKRSLLRVLASTPAATRLLCLELFLSHTLPLNYSYLDLDLCLSLLATVPKLDIRWRRTWSWLDVHPIDMGQRVCQKREIWKHETTKREILAEHEAITWTILWSTEQNAVQIISLMLWTVSNVTDCETKVMKLNEG
jgi:hypothetical protein